MTCAVEVARGVEVPAHGFEQCSDGVDDRRLERTIARDTLADLAAASQRFRHGQGPGQGRAYAGIAELAAFPGLRRVGVGARTVERLLHRSDLTPQPVRLRDQEPGERQTGVVLELLKRRNDRIRSVHQLLGAALGVRVRVQKRLLEQHAAAQQPVRGGVGELRGLP